MRARLVALATVVVCALLLAPAGAAHRGLALIYQDRVEFSFTRFEDPSTTIRETVTVDGRVVATRNFTLQGSSGGNTISLQLGPGRHVVVAEASWENSQGGGGTSSTTTIDSRCAAEQAAFNNALAAKLAAEMTAQDTRRAAKATQSALDSLKQRLQVAEDGLAGALEQVRRAREALFDAQGALAPLQARAIVLAARAGRLSRIAIVTCRVAPGTPACLAAILAADVALAALLQAQHEERVAQRLVDRLLTSLENKIKIAQNSRAVRDALFGQVAAADAANQAAQQAAAAAQADLDEKQRQLQDAARRLSECLSR